MIHLLGLRTVIAYVHVRAAAVAVKATAEGIHNRRYSYKEHLSTKPKG